MCKQTDQKPDHETLHLGALLAFQDDSDAFEPIYTDDYGREHTLRYLDENGTIDDNSVFYVAGFEHGPHVLIHIAAYGSGDGFEAAWAAWIDSLPTIPKEELPEAYQNADGESFDDLARAKLNETDPCPNYWEREAWDAWHAKKSALASELLASYGASEEGVYPDLVEGYEYSNGEVKDVGHYAWMSAVDAESIRFVRKAKEGDTNE